MYADAGKNSERVTQSNKRAKKLDGKTGVRRYGLVYGLLEQKEDLTDAGWRKKGQDGESGEDAIPTNWNWSRSEESFFVLSGLFSFLFSHLFLSRSGRKALGNEGPGEHSGSTDGSSPQIWAYGR